MPNPRHAVISAAGLGSRLGMNIPKCLLRLQHRTLIETQLDLLKNIPDVRVVVGYKEMEVIDHVRRNWPDVTFVRNPDYATTSNTHSLRLASQHLTDPFVAVDGDLLLVPASFRAFLDACAMAERSIIGITPRGTEEAIAVCLDERGWVTGFLRSGEPGYEQASHEWCGIAYVKDIRLDENERYVFEELAKHLPLPGQIIECYEIDTPRDLEKAKQALKQFP
jgi:choline kinase